MNIRIGGGKGIMVWDADGGEAEAGAQDQGRGEAGGGRGLGSQLEASVAAGWSGGALGTAPLPLRCLPSAPRKR